MAKLEWEKINFWKEAVHPLESLEVHGGGS
jgi:hypothetical protein